MKRAEDAMQLERQDFDDTAVIRVRESRIDAAVAIQFKDALRDLAGAAPRRIVLDLGRVDFLDSSGLGAVVAAMKLLGPDRKLELAALTPAVDKVFRLTRMDTVFTIHSRAEDATGGLAQAG